MKMQRKEEKKRRGKKRREEKRRERQSDEVRPKMMRRAVKLLRNIEAAL